MLADNGGGGPDIDPDGDPIRVETVTSPGSAGGTVVINASEDGLRYTPAAGFVGTESFDYSIVDDQGGRSTATVTVTVNSTNSEPPVRGLDSRPDNRTCVAPPRPTAGASVAIVDAFLPICGHRSADEDAYRAGC